MAVSLATLLIQETKAKIYETAINVAIAIGLPVSSWQPGDPTRSLFHLESELLASLEENVAGFIASGFLDYATGDWLKILADQVYGVTVPEATAAAGDVVLTNTGGGVYTIDAGDLTFKNTASGKTYRNTSGGTLAAQVGITPGTLTVSVTADEPGSDSSAGEDEIDDLVTTLLGVTCTNPDAIVGIDEQSEDTTRQQCRDRLGRLSPNGPREAYADVARDSELTGTSSITRVRAYGESTTGAVTVYLAGPSGAVSAGDRTLVETAILQWATPLCITPQVLSVTSVSVAVTYELWIYKSVNKTAAEVADEIETALEQMFATRPIGGDIVAPAVTGKLYRSLIESTIRSTFPQAFRVTLAAPASDTSLTNGEVASLGAVNATINLVVDP
jgi:hypothetical protein